MTTSKPGLRYNNYGSEPTTVQWSTILKEDKETCWDETTGQMEQSQQSNILAPDTPNGSQSTTASQQTQCSPPLLQHPSHYN